MSDNLASMARSIRDNGLHPRDFVAFALRVPAFVDAHAVFLQRVFLGDRPRAVSFYVRAGLGSMFYNQACVSAAVAFLDAYNRVLDLAASDEELDDSTRRDLTARFARHVEALRSAGIVSPEESRLDAVRADLSVRNELMRQNLIPDNNIIGADSLTTVNERIDTHVNAVLATRGLTPPASATLEERIVMLFNSIGENLPV